MTIFSSKIAGATSLGLLVALAFTGCSSTIKDPAVTETQTKDPTPTATTKEAPHDKALLSYYEACGIKPEVVWETTQANEIKGAGEETAIDKRVESRCPGVVNISFLDQDRQSDSASQIPKAVTWTINEKKLPLNPDKDGNVRLNANISIKYNEGKDKVINGSTVILLNERDDAYYLDYEETVSDPYEQATTDNLVRAIKETSTSDTQLLW